MRWEIVLEGTDEFGLAHRSELTIDKDLERVSAGEIGFSVEDGKPIMAHLQQVVVKQQCEAYVLVSRFCADCEGFRRIKDYSKRKIRTVFGCVEVRSPRIMNCQGCLPHFCAAWTVLRDICPDQATPELMERSARLGSLIALSQSGGGDGRVPVARGGRSGRGSRPGRYFTTADTSKRELQSRTLQALQSVGYAGPRRGDGSFRWRRDHEEAAEGATAADGAYH